MEYCNFAVVVCPECGRRTTSGFGCGVYAMRGGAFAGSSETCDECRRRLEEAADAAGKKGKAGQGHG